MYGTLKTRDIRAHDVAIRNEPGHGDAPGSRYGSSARGLWPLWAAVLTELVGYLGGYWAEDEMASVRDQSVSQVVNDSPEPAELIDGYWFMIPRTIRQELGRSRHEVRRMHR